MISNDNESIGLKEKGVHYFAISIMIIVLVLAVFVVMTAVQKPQNNLETMPDVKADISQGKKKPLPDYMLEDIETDELDLLKP